MEKKDIKTLVIFILLVVGIITVTGINAYKNRKLENVDRKIKYVMGYTYDSVLNKGENLFSLTMSLMLDKDVFEYEKELDESISHYVIDKKSNYVKIKNFSLVLNNFTDNGINEYMNYKEIVYKDNAYYMQDLKVDRNNYIGSILEIDSYNEEIVTFKSTNYYCTDREYIGVLDEVPTCDYQEKVTYFDLYHIDNTFKIDFNENLINILS